MIDLKPSRGIEGVLVKLWRGGDYELTVTGSTEITRNFLRLHFSAPELLTAQSIHPTMWIRGWFPDGARSHQRGYTLVNPDPEVGTVDIDFALHDGVATRWARAAKAGDTLEVTVLGSDFAVPEPAPAGYVIVGDAASLPAINSLLAAIGDAPAQVFLEAAHDDDRDIPTGRADVTWIDREDDGAALVKAVAEAAFEAPDHFGWVACDNRTTRAVARVLREDYKIPRKSVKARAYWAA
ncbi:MAG: siderophore-interacting protein [Mycobacterium sp.]